MECLDSGHLYRVEGYDGGEPQTIRFLKRVGEGYPGNEAPAYGGTNCQDVIRVLIDRVKYLDSQIPCDENKLIIKSLANAFWQFEKRAAERHGIDFPYSIFHPDDAYRFPVQEDGHIYTQAPIFQALIKEAEFQPWKKDQQE
jgi:hypothetical protein